MHLVQEDIPFLNQEMVVAACSPRTGSTYDDYSGNRYALNITKTFSSGFTYGISASNERYEAEELRTYNKNGNQKTFTIPAVRQGFFISMFVGWTF